MKTEKGFTLIEIIVVIGIMTLIASGTTMLFLSTLSNNQREVIVSEMISSLRKAQTRAMDGENQSEFGIYFEERRYIEFQGKIYVEGQEGNIVNLLPSGIILENIDFNGSNTIYYERMTGEASDIGSIEIVVTGLSGSKKITVNKLGVINIEVVE